MNPYTLEVSKIDILFVLEILRVMSFPIPLWDIKSAEAGVYKKVGLTMAMQIVIMHQMKGDQVSLLLLIALNKYRSFNHILISGM